MMNVMVEKIEYATKPSIRDILRKGVFKTNLSRTICCNFTLRQISVDTGDSPKVSGAP